jgi:hypothetical protein
MKVLLFRDTAMLGEAYERLHLTGPEYHGYLSNHGPMVAEAMVRHGHGHAVNPWLDVYMCRLEEFPRGIGPIGSDWQEALGDVRRVADWTAFFRREMSEQPWRQVLNTWWPRLLPGVVAAATHGVIRVGHAVRALLADGEDDAHTAELAHGLAYWAARWQTVPAGHAAVGKVNGRHRWSCLPPFPGLPSSRAALMIAWPGSIAWPLGHRYWPALPSLRNRNRFARSSPPWSMLRRCGTSCTVTAMASCSYTL